MDELEWLATTLLVVLALLFWLPRASHSSLINSIPIGLLFLGSPIRAFISCTLITFYVVHFFQLFVKWYGLLPFRESRGAIPILVVLIRWKVLRSGSVQTTLRNLHLLSAHFHFFFGWFLLKASQNQNPTDYRCMSPRRCISFRENSIVWDPLLS